MRALIFVICFMTSFLFVSRPAKAQEQIDQFLKTNIPDAKKILNAYFAPGMESISLSLNQGWYNTAKPHKLFGVDLTLSVNAMTIPSDQMLFNPSKLGLQQVTLEPSSPNYPNAPTLFGPDKTPTFRTGIGPLSTTFPGLPGIDIKGNFKSSWIPIPIANFGIGLPKNTDLKLRYSPTLNLGDASKLKIFGVGVMHDIKQWIPGIKMLPFDLSAFVGYTKFNIETSFNSKTFKGQNQKAEFNLNATTIQAIVSKKISVLTVYGALGYNIAKSSMAVKGTYDINQDNDTADANEKDPIDLNFAASGFRGTAGFRLKLAVLTLHADYTVQKYKCFTVGLGISVR